MRGFWSAVAVCVVLPGAALAQPGAKTGPLHNYGFPYGPRVAPPWSYPFLDGGPTVGYVGAPGGETVGLLGVFGPNGPACRPRVPVYEPVPSISVPSTRLVRQWQTAPFPVLAGYGWHGLYNAAPRPRSLSVSVWPTGEGSFAAPAVPVEGEPGACLTLSLRVPSSAEVFVDGNRTIQTGTDRLFESPPLEAGRSYRYTVTAKWVEGGKPVEVTKEVTGAPGEVVRLDFAAPAPPTGK